MAPPSQTLPLDERASGLLYFDARVAIAEKMVYIEEFVRLCDDPVMLRWIRNRLSNPHKAATRKLDEMGALDTSKKKIN